MSKNAEKIFIIMCSMCFLFHLDLLSRLSNILLVTIQINSLKIWFIEILKING